MYDKNVWVKKKRKNTEFGSYMYNVTYANFDVTNNRGYVSIEVVDGKIVYACWITWGGKTTKDVYEVLNKLIQMHPRAFVDVYKQLNSNSEEFELAKQVVEKKKQRLLLKEKLTKAERELLSL